LKPEVSAERETGDALFHRCRYVSDTRSVPCLARRRKLRMNSGRYFTLPCRALGGGARFHPDRCRSRRQMR